MKTTMDQDTILFLVNDRSGLAFNYNFYKNNYTAFSNKLTNANDVYYKMGELANTWIDYKKAIQLKSGSYDERLLAAFNDPDFIISDLRKIPQTEFYDEDGFKYNIAPYDGTYNSIFWVKRVVFNLEAIQCEFLGDDLKVTFAPEDDITNALISLDTIFYDYDIINIRTVIFRNVKPFLPQTSALDYTGYDFKIDAYAWVGLDKREEESPLTRNGLWYSLEYPIEENSIIIYKGVVYDYELDYTDKRKFKLKDVELSVLETFEIDRIKVHEFISQDINRECRKYVSNGIANRYRDCVEFTLPITDSMILFNGVDNDFEVVDTTAIIYPQTLFSVNHVSNLSFITAVNFTLGL